jgi:hypothetical protein
MTDSTIIWKFLTYEYPDDHPVVYLYVCGNVRSPKTAIDKSMLLLREIFAPAMSEHTIKTVLIAYLDRKKKQYLKGEIRVKALY